MSEMSDHVRRNSTINQFLKERLKENYAKRYIKAPIMDLLKIMPTTASHWIDGIGYHLSFMKPYRRINHSVSDPENELAILLVNPVQFNVRESVHQNNPANSSASKEVRHLAEVWCVECLITVK